MSSGERYWNRCLAYSRWHRADSWRALGVPAVQAAAATQIDIDWCEYCARCRRPLFLIEVTHGRPKAADVTTRLAAMAGIGAWSVGIEHAGDHDGHSHPDVFWVDTLPLSGSPQRLEPLEYIRFLFGLRSQHICGRDTP